MNRKKLNLNVLKHGLSIVVKTENGTTVSLKLIGTVNTLEGKETLLIKRSVNGTSKLGTVNDLEEVRKLLPMNFISKDVGDVERLSEIKNPLPNLPFLSEDLHKFYEVIV